MWQSAVAARCQAYGAWNQKAAFVPPVCATSRFQFQWVSMGFNRFQLSSCALPNPGPGMKRQRIRRNASRSAWHPTSCSTPWRRRPLCLGPQFPGTKNIQKHQKPETLRSFCCHRTWRPSSLLFRPIPIVNRFEPKRNWGSWIGKEVSTCARKRQLSQERR